MGFIRIPPRAGLLILLLAHAGSVLADVASSESAIRDVAGEVSRLARDVDLRVGEDRERYVEERLADGEMFFRLRFYEEASIVFLDIVDNYPDSTASADALFQLAEALYQADDPYGAKEYFEQVLQHASENRFRPYLQRALGRLIEIAIRTEDFQGIERYFGELSRMPTREVEAITPYFRGKYYFFRGDTSEAERAFMAVPEGSQYTLQARYFLAVLLTKTGDYARALDGFQRVLVTPATTDEDKVVVDLTYLAVGRLSYELFKEDEAIDAYQRISTSSRFFDRALYEVAWVHLARGDTTKARRALEMLIIYDPESRFAPEAKVLLGNILLREGRLVSDEQCFLLDTERRIAEDDGGASRGGSTPSPAPQGEPAPAGCEGGGRSGGSQYAVDAFEGVRAEYGTLFDEVGRVTDSQQDVRAYFRSLIESGAGELAAPSLLPPLARAWFRGERTIDRAQGAVDGLAAIRRFIGESERLVNQLEAILSGRGVVGAFADLRTSRDQAVLIANRCAKIRADLAGERDRVSGASGGEIDRIRQERRAVEARIRELPTSADGMSSDYDAQRSSINGLSHDLTEVTHTIELVDSMATSLDSYVLHPEDWGSMTEAEIEAIRAEIRLAHGAVDHYREVARSLRERVDVLRAQVQVGEVGAETAAELRNRQRDLVQQESALLQRMGQTGGAVARVDGALGELGRVESDLNLVGESLSGQAEERSARLLETVRAERTNLDRYRSRLASVESAAEQVVGDLAYQNFRTITDKFEDLILRADVGVVDSAWSLSEEHRRRMILMGQQRDRELEAIRMEYDDLLEH